jgi:hypothetical protein
MVTILMLLSQINFKVNNNKSFKIQFLKPHRENLTGKTSPGKLHRENFTGKTSLGKFHLIAKIRRNNSIISLRKKLDYKKRLLKHS